MPIPAHPSLPNVTRRSDSLPLRVGVALGCRIVLFAGFQGLAAAVFALAGAAAPWSESVAWWPVTVVAANLVSLALLRGFLRSEGHRYRSLLEFRRDTIATDVLITLGVLAVGGVLATAPNVGLAALLWSDPSEALALFVQPLPIWAAVVALIGFPATIALSELPIYYAYARPRLEHLGAPVWLALLLAASMHALQHVTLPLIFDARFMLWRAAMFLPFALFIGLVLRWRPRLLPYLMIAHALLDVTVALMVLQASS